MARNPTNWWAGMVSSLVLVLALGNAAVSQPAPDRPWTLKDALDALSRPDRDSALVGRACAWIDGHAGLLSDEERKAAVDALAKHLQADRDFYCVSVLRTLAGLCPQAEVVIPQMRKLALTGGVDTDVAIWTAHAFFQMRTPAAIDSLGEVLGRARDWSLPERTNLFEVLWGQFQSNVHADSELYELRHLARAVFGMASAQREDRREPSLAVRWARFAGMLADEPFSRELLTRLIDAPTTERERECIVPALANLRFVLLSDDFRRLLLKFPATDWTAISVTAGCKWEPGPGIPELILVAVESMQDSASLLYWATIITDRAKRFSGFGARIIRIAGNLPVSEPDAVSAFLRVALANGVEPSSTERDTLEQAWLGKWGSDARVVAFWLMVNGNPFGVLHSQQLTAVAMNEHGKLLDAALSHLGNVTGEHVAPHLGQLKRVARGASDDGQRAAAIRALGRCANMDADTVDAVRAQMTETYPGALLAALKVMIEHRINPLPHKDLLERLQKNPGNLSPESRAVVDDAIKLMRNLNADGD